MTNLKKITEYVFDHGKNRDANGFYVPIIPSDFDRPLTHEEMNYNLALSGEMIKNYAVRGNNGSDIYEMAHADIGKTLVFRQDGSGNYFWSVENVTLGGPSGPQGMQGVRGFQGIIGAQGITGTQGSTGVQGSTGAQGITGAQGVIGAQGVLGLQGSIGNQGNTGASTRWYSNVGIPPSIYSGPFVIGDQYLDSSNGNVYQYTGVSWLINGNIKGAQGSTGAQGSIGVQGTTGAQGVTGAQGLQGLQGLRGVQGFQGNQGNQGIAGTSSLASMTYLFTHNTSSPVNPTSTGRAEFFVQEGAFVINLTDNGGVDNTNRFIRSFENNAFDLTLISSAHPSSINQYSFDNVFVDFSTMAGAGCVVIYGATYNGNTPPLYNPSTGGTGDIAVSGNMNTDQPIFSNFFADKWTVNGQGGAQGVTGAQGNQGPTGLQGTIGSQGNTGTAFKIAQIYNSTGELLSGTIETGKFGLVAGTLSQSDPNYGALYYYDGASWTYITDMSVPGAAGIQGTQGGLGAQGNQGTVGNQGNQGNQGPTGQQGNQGPTGQQGNQGNQGPTGQQGNQGPTGLQGNQGPTGIQGTQGITGNQGNQGPTGQQGNQGYTGFQGITGSQGNQGPTGLQGNQGPTGIQGTQGITGNQGNQGPTGQQGNQGYTGFQGITGSQGNQGPTGLQGNQGPTGIQGTQGTTGNKGNQGNQGPTGAQGFQGLKSKWHAESGDPMGPYGGAYNFGDHWLNADTGDVFEFDGVNFVLVGNIQGPAGGTGRQGMQGPIGSQGNQGLTGIQGTIGSQGTTGNQGNQGTQGTIGFQGNTGMGFEIETIFPNLTTLLGSAITAGKFGIVGAPLPQTDPDYGALYYYNGSSWLYITDMSVPGTAGIQGPTGPQGTIGTQGNQGPNGLQGTVGAQGGTGFQGGNGSNGSNGTQGNQGPTGLQGTLGNQGNQGPTGFQGNQGPTGIQGTVGQQGNQGPTGLQGTVGQQGNQGPTGLQGTNGTQGNQGFTGIQGTVGTIGAQGFTGTPSSVAGPQGNQGPTGIQGTTGSQGNNGMQGNQGPIGVQGTVGSQGTVGLQGNQGNQGLVGVQGTLGTQGSQGTGFSVTYNRVIYVDPNGNNMTGIIGDPTKPFASIYEALVYGFTHIQKFTVYVNSGDYTDNISGTPLYFNNETTIHTVSLEFQDGANWEVDCAGTGAVPGSPLFIMTPGSRLNINGTGRSNNSIRLINGTFITAYTNEAMDAPDCKVNINDISIRLEDSHSYNENGMFNLARTYLNIDSSIIEYAQISGAQSYKKLIWMSDSILKVKNSTLTLDTVLEANSEMTPGGAGNVAAANNPWLIYEDLCDVNALSTHRIMIHNTSMNIPHGGGFISTNPATETVDRSVLLDSVYMYSNYSITTVNTLFNQAIDATDTYYIGSSCISGGKSPVGNWLQLPPDSQVKNIIAFEMPTILAY